MSELHLYPMFVFSSFGYPGSLSMDALLTPASRIILPPASSHPSCYRQRPWKKCTAVILHRFQHPQRTVRILPVLQQGIGIVKDCHGVIRKLFVRLLVHRQRILTPGNIQSGQPVHLVLAQILRVSSQKFQKVPPQCMVSRQN